MGEFLQRIRTQLSEFLDNLDRKQKIMYFGGGSALIMIIAVAILLLTKVEYVPLATNLSLEEAATITTSLTELSIPYKDADNTTTVLVPKSDLSRAKMQLTLNGNLTAKDFNWTQAFSNTSLTYTSDDKDKMYELAQETALAETIETIDSVERAKVNLTVPSDSAFLLNDQTVSKASVTLLLKGGSTLNPQQVNGIVMILVNSVKGLDANHVSIVDNTGRVLNEMAESSGQILANNQHELQLEVSDKLQKDLQSFLATIFGPDGVRVMAAVTLDFDSQVSSSKVFSVPIEGETTGLIRSMTEIQESTVNAGSSGVPGTDTNSEPTNYNEISGSGTEYQKASKTINYEMNETLTTVEKAQGQVEDITISVIINTSSLADETLTEEQRIEIKDLVSAAAGLDTKVVQVSAQVFTIPVDEFADAVEEAGGIPVWVIAVVAVVFVAGGLGAFMFMRRKAKTEEEERIIRELEEQREIEEIRLDEADQSSPKFQIEKFIESNPEVVSQLLRAWLNDD